MTDNSSQGFDEAGAAKNNRMENLIPGRYTFNRGLRSARAKQSAMFQWFGKFQHEIAYDTNAVLATSGPRDTAVLRRTIFVRRTSPRPAPLQAPGADGAHSHAFHLSFSPNRPGGVEAMQLPEPGSTRARRSDRDQRSVCQHRTLARDQRAK